MFIHKNLKCIHSYPVIYPFISDGLIYGILWYPPVSPADYPSRVSAVPACRGCCSIRVEPAHQRDKQLVFIPPPHPEWACHPKPPKSLAGAASFLYCLCCPEWSAVAQHISPWAALLSQLFSDFRALFLNSERYASIESQVTLPLPTGPSEISSCVAAFWMA
jgi:hypothetical protein